LIVAADYREIEVQRALGTMCFPSAAHLVRSYGATTGLQAAPAVAEALVGDFTEAIMPGVASLLQGTWPALDADGIDTAGCANVLTSTEPTLPSHGPRTHTVQVQVEKG
jgi:hypothetical protein